MKIFNPILSKCFIYSDLKFTDEGLFYVNQNTARTNKDDVLITTDYETICSLLGFEAIKIHEATEEEFFDMLIQSPKVLLKKFKEVRPNNKVELYEKFADYIKSEAIVEENEEFRRIKMEDFMNINSDFIEKLKESSLWLENREIHKRKLNGGTIREFVPTYEMSLLSETLPMFKESFESRREYELFAIRNDTETIVKEFLNRTNYKEKV